MKYILYFLSFVWCSFSVFSQNAYVAISGSPNVSVIDTSNNTVVATVPVGSGPLGIAITPNGN